MASLNTEIRIGSLKLIEHCDNLFHINVGLEDYDEAHKERMERDQRIRDYHEEYGEFPVKGQDYGFWT
jgi:hypothetical protein